MRDGNPQAAVPPNGTIAGLNEGWPECGMETFVFLFFTFTFRPSE